jgi:hypothetical protein
MTEIYKDIKEYEGLYQISNFGNVKSLPKGDGNGNRTRVLKQEVMICSHTTYRRVTLSKNGKTRRFQTHRLVADAFIPNTDNLPVVNHIDNNGANNKVENLEWVTFADNMAHSAVQGRQDIARSLGGIATGALKTQKAFDDATAKINKTFGNLRVISVELDTNLKKPRLKFKCLCSCGNTTEKTKWKLETGAQACKECTYKIRSQTRKKDDDIVSTI